MATPNQNHSGQEQQTNFLIERIYTKDLSFESPDAPKVFMQQWEPATDFNLEYSHENLGNDHYEVIVSVTVTVKHQKQQQVVFLIEVKQAGIFTIKGFPQEAIEQILGATCPSIIYPYLRAVVADTVERGGFPQLNLMPVNFDALYMQRQQEQHGKQ